MTGSRTPTIPGSRIVSWASPIRLAVGGSADSWIGRVYCWRRSVLATALVDVPERPPGNHEERKRQPQDDPRRNRVIGTIAGRRRGSTIGRQTDQNEAGREG